jgi:DNA-binding transcriptional ArsR family regulator
MESLLLPLARSRNQLLILGQLFVFHDREWSSTELVAATGAAPATVSRELARLGDAGLIRRRMVGRTLVVRAETDTPMFPHLRSMMMLAYGPIPTLTGLLARHDGIDEAHIVGSWAHRWHGTPGHWPHDVDVAVIGAVGTYDLIDVEIEAKDILGMPVQIIVLTPQKWAAEDGFAGEVKANPMIRLDLTA